MPDNIKIIVVCEDRAHQHFVRYFLRAYYNWTQGHVAQVLRFSKFPYDGRGGDAKKHVTSTYARERNELPRNKILIAVIDADDKTVLDRHAQLPRSSNEKIVHVIPKWSIDTWIDHALGQDVAEDVQWKQRAKVDKNKIRIAAKNLANRTKASDTCPPNAPDSIVSALSELHKFREYYSQIQHGNI